MLSIKRTLAGKHTIYLYGNIDMKNVTVWVLCSGIIGALGGAFLLYRQRPGTKHWLIWIAIAVGFLLGILLNT
jgi:uncharacterized membrane protein YfcA